MRINRKLATLVVALFGATGIFVAAPPAAAGVPTITGTAVCDAATASWTVSWTVTNTNETPMPIVRVSTIPAPPVGTLTGIEAGDVVPPRSEGPLTATEVVHSYGAIGSAKLTLTVGGDFVTNVQGAVHLSAPCGTPIPPVPTFQSRCDDLLVSVALPHGGHPVNVEVYDGGTGQVFDTLALQPGPPVQSVAVPWNLASNVRVRIVGVMDIASGRWAYPASCLPPSLGTFQLLAQANYRYVDWGLSTVSANLIGTNEPSTRVEAHDVGGGDVALRAVNRGTFVTVSATDGSLSATSVKVFGDAEKFRLVTNANGTVGLRAKLNGKYVNADRTAPGPLRANRDSLGPWETFGRYTPGKGPVPLMSRFNSRYVSAAAGGAQPLIANRDVVGQWEFFLVEDRGNGTVALKALANGKYVCAESAGTKPLIANRTAVGPWETFRLIDIPDGTGTMGIQALANNRYVSAASAGTQPLIANRDYVSSWEKFYALS